MNFFYVVQRLDNGEYFKKTKSDWCKNWPADDPRRKFWTKDLDSATLYSFEGARAIKGNVLNFLRDEKYVPDRKASQVAIVRLRLEKAGYVKTGDKE